MCTPKVSVLAVIPCYNEASTIRELTERIRKSAPAVDILIVNDGSTDNTAEFIDELSIPHLTHSERSGKGSALRAGFRYAKAHGYEAILTMDADLQHAPEDIPRLLEAYDGSSIVIGTRSVSDESMPPQRKLSNNLTSLFISLFSGQRIRDSQSGFRLLPTAISDELHLTCSGFDFESELLFKSTAAGFVVTEVPVGTIYRGSVSRISPFYDILKFIRLVWKRIWM